MLAKNRAATHEAHTEPLSSYDIAPQIQVSRETCDPDWDRFVAATPGGHHVQTSLWAQIKATLGWQALRVVAKRNEEILGGGQMLIRPVPILGSVGYLPKGPLIANDDLRLADLVVKTLRRAARAQRVQYIILQPPDNGERLARLLPSWEFRPSSFKAFPTATVMIDLEQDLDTILAKMKPETRRNVRLAERKGIIVRQGTEDDLSTFYRIFAATSQRQNFSIYPQRYYSEMRRILGPLGSFVLFLAEYQGEAVSAMFAIPFGNTVIFKRGGWSGRHGNRRPNELMHWTALRWAKSQGYHYYNFEGIDPAAARVLLEGRPLPKSVAQSVTRFKLGFGGQVTLLPGVYDHVSNSLLRWSYYGIYPKLSHWRLIKHSLNYLRAR